MIDRKLPIEIRRELIIVGTMALWDSLKEDPSLFQQTMYWLHLHPEIVCEKDVFRIYVRSPISSIIDIYGENVSNKKMKIILQKVYPLRNRQSVPYWLWCDEIKHQMTAGVLDIPSRKTDRGLLQLIDQNRNRMSCIFRNLYYLDVL